MTPRDKARCEVYGWADDVLAEMNLFALLLDALPSRPVYAGVHEDIWKDDKGDIICRTKDHAEAVADWLNDHGDTARVGYYDPEEHDYPADLAGMYFVT